MLYGAKSDWGESWWPSEPEATPPPIRSNRDRWHEDAGAEESDDEAAASDDAVASGGAAAESDGHDQICLKPMAFGLPATVP